MKQYLILFACILGFTLNPPYSPLFGQASIQFNYGASKADYNFWTLSVSHELGSKIRVGLEFEASDYRYRFIDARAVSNGFAGTGRLLFMGKLAESELLRLDFFVKPGLRFIQAPDDPEDFDFPTNYNFQNSFALTLDPGFLIQIKALDRLNFHTGMNLHTALQVDPEALLERFPATIVLAGASFAFKDRWVLFSNNMFGPAAGASGDTEKFFWSTSIGVRFSFNMDRLNQLVSGF